jgi:hypothetical protein
MVWNSWMARCQSPYMQQIFQLPNGGASLQLDRNLPIALHKACGATQVGTLRSQAVMSMAKRPAFGTSFAASISSNSCSHHMSVSVHGAHCHNLNHLRVRLAPFSATALFLHMT